MVKQDITGNGGTGYTLSHPVSNENDILLYINNVKQEGGSGKAFTASGTTLTLSEAIANTDTCYVQYIGLAIQTVVPPDGSVSTAKIADSAVNLTSKVTGVLPIANGGTGNAIGSTTTYVNNLTVSGSNVTSFDTNFTGTALNGGAKGIKIFLTQLGNNNNAYLHFRTLDANGTTDGGYNATFQFNTGSTPNANGNTDSNQANAMAVAYYAGTYNIVIDCQLIDPSTNLWAFSGMANSVLTNAPVSGGSIAYNALGSNNPITGFRWASTTTNGLAIGNLKYGYSYTV